MEPARRGRGAAVAWLGGGLAVLLLLVAAAAWQAGQGGAAAGVHAEDARLGSPADAGAAQGLLQHVRSGAAGLLRVDTLSLEAEDVAAAPGLHPGAAAVALVRAGGEAPQR